MFQQQKLRSIQKKIKEITVYVFSVSFLADKGTRSCKHNTDDLSPLKVNLRHIFLYIELHIINAPQFLVTLLQSPPTPEEASWLVCFVCQCFSSPIMVAEYEWKAT